MVLAQIMSNMKEIDIEIYNTKESSLYRVTDEEIPRSPLVIIMDMVTELYHAITKEVNLSITDFTENSCTITLKCEFCEYERIFICPIEQSHDTIENITNIKCSQCSNTTATGESRSKQDILIFRLLQELEIYNNIATGIDACDEEAMYSEAWNFADNVKELLNEYSLTME